MEWKTVKYIILIIYIIFSLSCSKWRSPIVSEFGSIVLSVSDGDTLSVTLNNGRTIKVRLYGIDAPEIGQPNGLESKNSLMEICEVGKKAHIDLMSADRYGRIVAQLFCNEVNANLYQLFKGLAWVYSDYADNETILIKYLSAQNSAKINRLGIWSEENPRAPWNYRKQKTKQQ